MPFNNTKFQLLRGEALLRVLAQTTQLVKWLGPRGDLLRRIDAGIASQLVAKGGFEGKARTGRVYFIRPTPCAPESSRDDSFWYEMPALRNFRSLKTAAQADYSFNREARARMQQLRHRDYFQDISKIPTGLWLPE